jgi:hypothetical protein
MIGYSSNQNQVIAGLIAQLNELQTDKVLRIAALDAQAIIQNRIQQKGSGTNGSYSSNYAKKRRKAGRQTRIKDLTMQGDMFRSWISAKNGQGWATGFAAAREAKKAEWLEIRFGPIFYLSNSELTLIEKSITTEINAIFKR